MRDKLFLFRHCVTNEVQAFRTRDMGSDWDCLGEWIVIPCCLAIAAWRFFDFVKDSI